MKTTHDDMDGAISQMEIIVSKGQPFAKRNKERRIRAVLREMRLSQAIPPTIGEVCSYLKMWALGKASSVWNLASRAAC